MDVGARRFDPDLQMFIEQPREIDLGRLRFLRWLAEHGRLEHEPVGAAAGVHTADPLATRPPACR
jgi:hypothetical protein